MVVWSAMQNTISSNQSKRSTGHVSVIGHTDPLPCDSRAAQGIEPHPPCAHLECTHFHKEYSDIYTRIHELWLDTLHC
jgi:hypothetical protein